MRDVSPAILKPLTPRKTPEQVIKQFAAYSM